MTNRDDLHRSNCENIYNHVKDGDGKVSSKKFMKELESLGILADDPRVSEVLHSFNETGSLVDKEAFINCISKNASVIKNAFGHTNVIKDFRRFADDVREIFYAAKMNKDGQLLDNRCNNFYHTDSKNALEDYFGVSVCTTDGQRVNIGDADVKLCVQHIAKPINYCLGIEEHGVDKVHEYVGREPSGNAFNALKLNRNGLPHNPLINSGAIMMCSLIKHCMNPGERFEFILNLWEELAGGKKVGYSNIGYLTEKKSTDRNFALAYFMKEKKAFPPDASSSDALDFFMQCCSLLVTPDQLSIVAATFANGGMCPLSGKQVISAEAVQHCLSIMFSCGMYEYSGEFAFRFGLPAKSGSTGALFVVIPNLMGICTFSPLLDEHENSTRGIEFFSHLTAKFNFHLFSNFQLDCCAKNNPQNDCESDITIEEVIHYSSLGDVGALKRLRIKRDYFSQGDYDKRTPLHLSATNGHLEVVKYLLGKGGVLEVNPLDRWNGTPYDDAVRNGHTKVIEFLASSGGVAGKLLKGGIQSL